MLIIKIPVVSEAAASEGGLLALFPQQLHVSD